MRLLWILACFLSVVSSIPFITTWNITSFNETITIPLNTVGGVALTVDWGDGVVDFNLSTLPVAHMYNISGVYNVSIFGDVKKFTFGGGGGSPEDKLKLIDIVSWGDTFFIDTDSSYAFSGCLNLRAVSAPPNTQPVFLPATNLFGMFMSSGFNSPLNWDLTNVTAMSSMFQGAVDFNQPLNFSNTQGVTDTSYMLYGATSMNSPVTLDTTNVITMAGMFGYTNNFNQPVNFNTGQVQSMEMMFYHASAFNQPINFNTSSLTQAKYMFYSAWAFNSPVTFSNTSRLGNTRAMFFDTPNFNQPITFQTDNVTDMSSMFSISSFNQPLLSSFNTGLHVQRSKQLQSAYQF